MESESITFAGYGEPLLSVSNLNIWSVYKYRCLYNLLLYLKELDVITRAAEMIKDSHHGANLRVKTNGLISTKESLKGYIKTIQIFRSLSPNFWLIYIFCTMSYFYKSQIFWSRQASIRYQ
jgi:hypothetical protein